MFIDGKARNMAKVSKLCTKVVYNFMSQHLNTVCLIYTNLPHP